MTVAIVTDSTSDVPADLAQRYKISIVANFLMIGDKSYQDGIDITREQFYALLPTLASPPTTASPSPAFYEQLYRRLFEQGYSDIISIHPPSYMSAIYNTASLGAKEFGERVHLFDSEQLSLGSGFQVLAAAEVALQGIAVESIIELLVSLRLHARVFAMLDTLEYVRRSGRVSWARTQLGNLLQIKPFIEVRMGQIIRQGDARTRRKGIERLREFLLGLGPLERLAVMHTNAERDAREFLGSLQTSIPPDPLLVNVTPIIGTHVGPNGLGFAAIIKPEA